MKVYLAGPWFYGDQPEKLSKVESCLDSFGALDVFSPRRESCLSGNASKESRTETFNSNVEHVKNADFIVAIVDDSDKGTLFECGMAYAYNVPILYYSEHAHAKPFNLMLAESCLELGYVTNIDDLKKRLAETIEKGLENMCAERFEGIIE